MLDAIRSAARALGALAIWLVVLCLAPFASAADFVVHISVDGLRPDYMQTLIDNGSAPNFKRFQTEGAWTNNARTDFSYTNTLPNHTSMLTGRPVLRPGGMPGMTEHGYTDNDDPAPTTTLHNFTNPDYYKASVFDVVHDAGFSTALFASKNKFILFDQSYSATTGAPHANGQDKIDTYFGPEASATMQSELLAELATNHFTYTFAHYADTDDAGHHSGWGSTAWNNALVTIDGYLGQLFHLIETDTALAGKTTILLSADHGGTGTAHNASSVATNYTIPFFAWGAGVTHGDLYTINGATRKDPGTGRPDYSAVGQPIRNGDGGNLVLSLLGLDPIPGSLINAAQDVRVGIGPPIFGDYNANGIVDAGDYTVWRNSLGAPAGTLLNDGDGGVIGQAQYDTWKTNFGNTAGNGSVDNANAAVPEQATAAMLAVAMLATSVCRCVGGNAFPNRTQADCFPAPLASKNGSRLGWQKRILAIGGC